MSIKKRLFISNILMIALTVVIAAVISIVSIITINELRAQNSDEVDLVPIRQEIVELTQVIIEKGASGNLARNELYKAQIIMNRYGMSLEVYENKRIIFHYGNREIQSEINTSDALDLFDGTSMIIVKGEVMYTEQIMIGEQQYTICIYNTELMDPDETAVIDPLFIFVVLLATTLAVMCVNKFLINFVVKRIEEPLQVLTEGVEQISQGNLSWHIDYNTNDEFLPVCHSFNEMAQRLKDSVEQTQRDENNRKELLASISHDIRSPLTSIKAYVEGLIDGVAVTPEMQQRYMTTIKTKADDIERLVSRLFIFSKIDMGNYPYVPEKLNLSAETLTIVHAAADTYKDQLLIETSIQPDLLITGDKMFVQSIINNIIDNSVKYRPSASPIRMLITLKRLTNQGKGDFVQLCIEDNGNGVPYESLDKLFDVFYRVDDSRTDTKKGSGLGLAIVAKSIQRMDGSVEAQNVVPHGLRIIITLPALIENETTPKGDN